MPKESLIVVGTATTVAGVLGLMLTDELATDSDARCLASPSTCGVNSAYYVPAALVTGAGGAMLVTGSIAVVVDHKASPTIHLSGRF